MTSMPMETIGLAVQWGGWIAAGVFAVLGFIGIGTRQRRQDNDGLTDTLIKRLQQTVDQQEKTIGEYTKKLDQTTKELHQMQGRNTVLEDLFNGSETSILGALKQIPGLVQLSNETRDQVKGSNEAIKALTDTMRDFINKLPSLTPTMTA